MSSNCDNINWSGCCDSTQYRSNCPPSNTPPWSRAIRSPQNQTLTGDGTIDLTKEFTFLDSIVPKDSGDALVPYEVALPNGNYIGQSKQIYIKKANESTTAVFLVTGTIVGYTAIRFNNLGWAAILTWVSDGWSWVGGNAALE